MPLNNQIELLAALIMAGLIGLVFLVRWLIRRYNGSTDQWLSERRYSVGKTKAIVHLNDLSQSTFNINMRGRVYLPTSGFCYVVDSRTLLTQSLAKSSQVGIIAFFLLLFIVRSLGNQQAQSSIDTACTPSIRPVPHRGS